MMCMCLEKIKEQGYVLKGIYRQRVFAAATTTFIRPWVAEVSKDGLKTDIILNYCPICGKKMRDLKLSGEKHDE